MRTPWEERLDVNVAAPGGDGEAECNAIGWFCYLDITHPAAGEPDYYVEIINERGSVVWEAPQMLTGDTVVHVGERISTRGHSVRIRDSTLSGAFVIYSVYEK